MPNYHYKFITFDPDDEDDDALLLPVCSLFFQDKFNSLTLLPEGWNVFEVLREKKGMIVMIMQVK